ncbi:proteasome component pup2 [Geranomyces michiganensis]|nr:proteasome component pup2 [Geranomyces michiganensis]
MQASGDPKKPCLKHVKRMLIQERPFDPLCDSRSHCIGLTACNTEDDVGEQASTPAALYPEDSAPAEQVIRILVPQAKKVSNAAASTIPHDAAFEQGFCLPLTPCGRSEYDRGVNTFSPEGRLFQVEYAIEAIKLGSTAVGIQTSQGVVLAVEKRATSTLLEPSSIEKILEIDAHLGCAMSGLTADSRTMIDHSRVEAQNHWFTYNERIKVESVTQAVCDLALRFGESANSEEALMSRPFGVALLIAGIDEKGPQLFHTDPSGTFMRYDAKAIGSGSEGAQSELQEQYHKSLTLEEAKVLSLKVLKQVMEEKLSSTNVQIAVVVPITDDFTNKKKGGFSFLSETECQAVIDQLA